MTYTTAQLIEFLDRELQANWRGERQLLSPTHRINHPAIAMALDPNKLSKVFAYREFRAEIHDYQREHSVSGIVWRSCRFREDELRLPELHNHLVAIDGDKEVLMAAKAETISFWRTHTAAMKFWLSDGEPASISSAELEQRIDDAEWVIRCRARRAVFGLVLGKSRRISLRLGSARIWLRSHYCCSGSPQFREGLGLLSSSQT